MDSRSTGMNISRYFGFRERVDRGFYFRTGSSLMAVKYGVDAMLIWLATGRIWTPVDYFIPLLSVRSEKLEAFPAWLSLLLIVWTLPFIWIGVSMTLRRAVDAGRSPWWCLAFLLPGLNYAAMLWLSMLPGRPEAGWYASDVAPSAADRVRSALIGFVACIGLGLLSLLVNVFALQEYGATLFLATPFLLGAVSAYIYNQGHPRGLGETANVVLVSLALVGGSFILFALEGIVCIAMAFPLALIAALLGGGVGRAVAVRSGAGPLGLAPGLLIIPLGLVVDVTSPPATVREAMTSVEIDAPPERVWDEVVAFRRIEQPPEWIFRLGIAYPVEATLSGSGVGAERRCEFSTGAFVEPITAWDRPYRLAFGVTEHPPALQEWSPYRRIYTPHVEGYFRSVRGEFRLVPLADGRTRLEGRTWYRLEIRPEPYWNVVSEWILHRIHGRVLMQVKRDAERRRVPAVG